MCQRKAKVLWAAVCVLALVTAIGAGAAGLPNPVREVTAEELREETGIVFPLPEGAREVAYSIIEMQDEEDISQVRFTLHGAGYCCRMQPAVGRKDISGMHYEWEAEDSVNMAVAQAAVYYNEGEAGMALWYSGFTGMACSVSMDAGATLYALGAVATLIDATQGPREHNAPIPGDYDIQRETILTVRLRANPTTGYRWTYEISREEALRCDQEEYIADENPEGLTGTGGTYAATFSPTMDGAGWVSLTFRYAREGEEEPAETYVFRVWITEAGTLSVEEID